MPLLASVDLDRQKIVSAMGSEGYDCADRRWTIAQHLAGRQHGVGCFSVSSCPRSLLNDQQVAYPNGEANVLSRNVFCTQKATLGDHLEAVFEKTRN